LGVKRSRPRCGVGSMHLKDAMRGRAVSTRWRLAERWYGASPEARIALRERLPLASLPSDASQSSSRPPCAAGETDAAYRSGSAAGGRDQPVSPLPVLGSHSAWTGPRARATDPILFACSMTDTGEPAREVQESGAEAGETRTAISEALPAVRVGRGVGVWESHMHGEGPEGEGRETGQTTQGTRKRPTRDVGESWRNGSHHTCPYLVSRVW
jgi:hypothetical protein